jgi:hypothetical protein
MPKAALQLWIIAALCCLCPLSIVNSSDFATGSPIIVPANMQRLLSLGFEPEPLELLEYQILEAFDYGAAIALPELPPERAADMAKLRWLHNAAYSSLPVSVFSAGSPEQKEAKGVLQFLKTTASPTEQNIGGLGLSLTGSQLALWRFGQANVRNGAWGRATRIQWEARLLEAPVHPIIQGFALRHALCWALAENDEKRFADLKHSEIGEGQPIIFALFQKAFAALDGPLDALRLWTSSLSGAEGGTPFCGAVWVCPDPNFPPPGATKDLIGPPLETALTESADGPAWAARAGQMTEEKIFADYRVFFAPFQKDMDMLGIALFPALLELGEDGNIKRIQMGDACPRAAATGN